MWHDKSFFLQRTSATFGLNYFFCISSVCWHFCCSSNKKCPDSVCHIKIDAPEQTAKTVYCYCDVVVMKANHLEQFKSRYTLLVACTDFTMLWQSYQVWPVYCIKTQLFSSGVEKANSHSNIILFVCFHCCVRGLRIKFKRILPTKSFKQMWAQSYWPFLRTSQHSSPCLSGVQKDFV